MQCDRRRRNNLLQRTKPAAVTDSDRHSHNIFIHRRRKGHLWSYGLRRVPARGPPTPPAGRSDTLRMGLRGREDGAPLSPHLSVISLWCTYVGPMGCLRHAYAIPSSCLWHSYGLTMAFLWDYYYKRMLIVTMLMIISNK